MARIKKDEKLQYQLEKERSEKQEALAELNAYRLKEKATKLASEKRIERSLLDLIDFKTVTAETLKDNMDNLSKIFNKAVEKTINEKLKEDVPIAKRIN